MSQRDNIHPITNLRDGVRDLSAHAHEASRQAAHGAKQANSAVEALAALDTDRIFDQLREMVSLVTQPQHEHQSAEVLAFPGRQRRNAQDRAEAARSVAYALPQAAE